MEFDLFDTGKRFLACHMFWTDQKSSKKDGIRSVKSPKYYLFFKGPHEHVTQPPPKLVLGTFKFLSLPHQRKLDFDTLEVFFRFY